MQERKRYKGPDAGKKNLEDIWVLFDQMAHNKTNLTLVTDSTHFPPLNICDINADQCTFLLKQTASYFVTHGSSVHAVCLDALKAFDRDRKSVV